MFSSGSSGSRIALVSACLLIAASSRLEAQGEIRKIRLSSVAVRPDDYRLGPGLGGTLPKKAWRAKVDDTSYLFFDLDGDGIITPNGADGIGLKKHLYVVPLPDALLHVRDQYALNFEGKTLLLTPLKLGLATNLIEEAAFLTQLRIRGARSPLVIDAEASKHAELHIDYMEFNGLTRGEVSLDVHVENPEARGYTSEGAKAGRMGILGMGKSFRRDLENWFATVYHAVPLLDPSLRRIGVARKFGVSMLVPVDRRWKATELVVHPPDGGTEVPLRFSEGGEVPTPVPGTNYGQGSGFPLVVMLPKALLQEELLVFELEDKRGRSVVGSVSSPSKPANEVRPDNAGSAFFIPGRPLIGGMRYTARLQVRGMEEPLEWSFTTRKPVKR